jgi:glycosyltransferase involved in cell wall biosynthesis
MGGTIKKKARYIFPVSNGYYNTLIHEGIDSTKLSTVPCTTDLQHFDIDFYRGKSLRDKFKLDEKALVGVYVGKFGDIYFDKEAFNLFASLKMKFPSLKLFVLSGQNKLVISNKLIQAGYSENDFFVGYVSHDKVPDFLNASNFAFCLHKPHYISYAYSPIKNGEYWACGLPVLIPDGIGDDSKILKETGLGVVMEDINHPEKYFPLLEKLIQADRKEEIRQLAVKYRNPETTKEVYMKIIDELHSGR